MHWVTILVVVMLLCSLQSEIDQLEEQIDQEVQSYMVFRKYVKLLVDSQEVIIIYHVQGNFGRGNLQ